MKKMELWGAVDCSLIRIANIYTNQCDQTGHTNRLGDLKLIADLGIKKLRYPCSWELIAPKNLDYCDWSYMDERLNEIQRLGMNPIPGFLNHGSGPIYTSLIDPAFPEKLATFARHFAKRYPWIDEYTPINDILFTAKKSCLEGEYYPHLEDNLYFLKAIFYQCRATVLAMKEIRRVNPKARLIQTDHIGKCQSTKPLENQRNFENELRWLSFDLLSGMVDHHHSLYKLILDSGIILKEIEWFQENTFLPHTIGINHHHLSNRFLDHRLELYPEWTYKENSSDTYADVAALETGQAELPQPESILIEAWNRYGLPLAVTEVHNKGYRESQMRWLNQIWKAATDVREKGVDIESVTAGNIFGSFEANQYTPGVFDLRNPMRVPQATALSELVKDLSLKGKSDSPLLKRPGEWKTQRRVIWATQPGAFSPLSTHQQRPILITGGSSTLGKAIARICGMRNIPYKSFTRSELDIADLSSVEKVIEDYKPWAIINTAGYVHLDNAEEDFEKCFRENVAGVTNIAEVSARMNVPMIMFSTAHVFDGSNDEGYTESDSKKPLNVYGHSKSISEEIALKLNPNALIIRTSQFFGPWDESNFVTKTLKSLLHNNPVEVPRDQRFTPTYLPDLAHECLNLLIDGEKGVIHVTNQGEVTWEELAKIAASRVKADPSLIISKPLSQMNFKAQRPLCTVLRSEKFHRLPSLEDALERYFSQLEIPLSG